MHNVKPAITFSVVTVLFLAGCGTVGERSEETGREIRDSLEEATVYEPPGEAETRDVLMPAMEPVAEPPPEERFDIRVKNAPARQFFMSLVADTDWNMVVHPEVEGTLSLELKNVTIPEVMEMAREMYGYEYRRTETGYMVMPPRLQSRIYEVNYLDVNRTGSSRTRVSSGQATENPAALAQSGDQQQGGARRGGRDDERERQSISGTRIETESESEFWKDLTEALETVIGEGEGRNVVVNPQAGIVSVRAMPEDHRSVAHLLEAIQGSVQRQVILEAKIIEVELRDAFRSGINWTALMQVDGRDLTFGQIAGSDLFEDGTAATREAPITVTPGQRVTGFESNAFGGPFAVAANAGDFNAFLELLESQGRTQVLSSPRVATVNNQKAVIKVGTDEFFVTDVESNTAVGGAASTTSRTVELTPFFSGIALDVIPQISRNGEIILHIHPTVSDVVEQTKTFTVDATEGGQFSLPLAFSSVRESDSIIRARNGQVVVIGGLMKDDTTEERIGTPGLSRLPLIGRLFDNRQERATKSELVILLRPIVIGADESWADQVRQPLERVRGMTGEKRP